MKIKFNPEIAYLTGFWKARKTREGVGIAGDSESQQIFISQAISTLGIPPEKIQVKGNKVFFYHSAYRRYLQKVVDEELETFKWQNEFSAKFVTGLFDGCGGVDLDKGTVFLVGLTDADQMILERLGLATRRRGRGVYVTAKCIPRFAAIVLRLMKREELKSRLSALMRSGNERDPR